jgi:hypothetical protein
MNTYAIAAALVLTATTALADQCEKSSRREEPVVVEGKLSYARKTPDELAAAVAKCRKYFSVDKVRIGMSKAEVLATWPAPKSTSKAKSDQGLVEWLVYDGVSVMLVNDKVSLVQE